MIELFMDNPLRMLGAFVIGVATGWWIWGRLSAKAGGAAGASTAAAAATAAPPPPPPAPRPTPAPEPKAEPVAPVMAAPKVQEEEGKPKIAAAVGEPDDLTRIKGIGPKLNDLCHSLGVQRFDQISKWSAADIAEVDQYLKIKGRIDRDEWVAQAKLLADGKVEEHANKFAMKAPPAGKS